MLPFGTILTSFRIRFVVSIPILKTKSVLGKVIILPLTLQLLTPQPWFVKDVFILPSFDLYLGSLGLPVKLLLSLLYALIDLK